MQGGWRNRCLPGATGFSALSQLPYSGSSIVDRLMTLVLSPHLAHLIQINLLLTPSPSSGWAKARLMNLVLLPHFAHLIQINLFLNPSPTSRWAKVAIGCQTKISDQSTSSTLGDQEQIIIALYNHFSFTPVFWLIERLFLKCII